MRDEIRKDDLRAIETKQVTGKYRLFERDGIEELPFARRDCHQDKIRR